MWIAAIRFIVHTKDAPFAGTDSRVVARVLRDGHEIGFLPLDHLGENDLERGATRNYDFRNLHRRNDETPELPDGIGQSPMPYPDHGYEFSHGMPGHLTVKLEIESRDMWIKDSVEFFVVGISRQQTSFDTEEWIEDPHWTHVHTWNQDVAMSTDSSEGRTTWKMHLN